MHESYDRSQPSMGPLTLLQSYDLSLFHFIPTVSSNPQYVLFLLSAEVPAAHLPEELEAITRDIPQAPSFCVYPFRLSFLLLLYRNLLGSYVRLLLPPLQEISCTQLYPKTWLQPTPVSPPSATFPSLPDQSPSQSASCGNAASHHTEEQPVSLR